MAVGEWGSVAVTPQVLGDDGWSTAPPGAKAERWRARTRVRDLDGKLRDVERYAPTRAQASRVLTDALRNRVTPAAADATIKPTMTVASTGEVWLADVEASGRLAANTVRVYRATMSKHVVGPPGKPGHLANLTLREVRVSHIDRFLRAVSTEHGPGAARMTRSVLRSLLDLAARHDAIPTNPVRSVGQVSSAKDRRPSQRDTGRHFTREERAAVLALADTDRQAVARDLGDLVAFMAGTGARIGEACAVRWPALDLSAALVGLGPTVVRIKGQGVTISEPGKTVTSTRTVRLPEWLVSRLCVRQSRATANDWDVVFPSARGHLRDPSNTSNDVRELLDLAGYGWASAHTFRKSVATYLDEAGVSGREVANQLGHSRPSMTQDVYMSRRTITERAADVL